MDQDGGRHRDQRDEVERHGVCGLIDHNRGCDGQVEHVVADGIEHDRGIEDGGYRCAGAEAEEDEPGAPRRRCDRAHDQKKSCRLEEIGAEQSERRPMIA